MAAIAEKYTLDLPKRTIQKGKIQKADNVTVVVTGTTSSLRINLLLILLSSYIVSKVYALISLLTLMLTTNPILLVETSH
jgi:hypothetical protein